MTDTETPTDAETSTGTPTDASSWEDGLIANLRANPNVELEVANVTFAGEAIIETGAERERLWNEHVRQLPWFAEYPAQVGREIPMVRLRRAPRPPESLSRSA